MILFSEGLKRIAFIDLVYRSTLSPFWALAKKGWSLSLSLSRMVAIVCSSSVGRARNFLSAPVMAAISLAEYFRDERKKDVLFFADNIFRFAQAGSELSSLTDRISSEDGYQPTLTSEMAAFHERLSATENGVVSAIEAIYVPSDDMLDSGVQAIYPFLDSIITLSRDVYQQGRLPAIDLLSIASSILSPQIVGMDHYTSVINAQQILKKARDLERMVALVGESELSAENRTLYHRALLLENYMTQPFFVAEKQSGYKGTMVSLKKTISDVKDILSGKHDASDPQTFFMIGGIDE